MAKPETKQRFILTAALLASLGLNGAQLAQVGDIKPGITQSYERNYSISAAASSFNAQRVQAANTLCADAMEATGETTCGRLDVSVVSVSWEGDAGEPHLSARIFGESYSDSVTAQAVASYRGLAVSQLCAGAETELGFDPGECSQAAVKVISISWVEPSPEIPPTEGDPAGSPATVGGTHLSAKLAFAGDWVRGQ